MHVHGIGLMVMKSTHSFAPHFFSITVRMQSKKSFGHSSCRYTSLQISNDSRFPFETKAFSNNSARMLSLPSDFTFYALSMLSRIRYTAAVLAFYSPVIHQILAKPHLSSVRLCYHTLSITVVFGHLH